MRRQRVIAFVGGVAFLGFVGWLLTSSGYSPFVPDVAPTVNPSTANRVRVNSGAAVNGQPQRPEHARVQRQQEEARLRSLSMAAPIEMLDLEPGARFVYQLEAQADKDRAVGTLEVAILKKQPRGLMARYTLSAFGKQASVMEELTSDPTANDLNIMRPEFAEGQLADLRPALELLAKMISLDGARLSRGQMSEYSVRPGKERRYGENTGREYIFRHAPSRAEGQVVRAESLTIPVLYASQKTEQQKISVQLALAQDLDSRPGH